MVTKNEIKSKIATIEYFSDEIAEKAYLAIN